MPAKRRPRTHSDVAIRKVLVNIVAARQLRGVVKDAKAIKTLPTRDAANRALRNMTRYQVKKEVQLEDPHAPLVIKFTDVATFLKAVCEHNAFVKAQFQERLRTHAQPWTMVIGSDEFWGWEQLIAVGTEDPSCLLFVSAIGEG